MNKEKLLIVLKNLGLLVFVALPLFFVFVWVQALIGGTKESRSLGYVLETGAFFYIIYVLYVALGGIVHQALLLLLPVSWPVFWQRVTAILLTPIIPITLIVLGERVQTITWFLIPVILMLGIYGLLIRLPNAPDKDTEG